MLFIGGLACAQPGLILAIFLTAVLLLTRGLWYLWRHRSVYQRDNDKTGHSGTAEKESARWIAGRRRARFKRYLPWFLKTVAVCNVALVATQLSSTRFLGGVLDTGAAMSCVGHNQAQALCRITGTKFELEPARRKFRFGDVISYPLGMLTVPLQTPAGPIPLNLHVVKQSIPLLIGTDIFDNHRIYVKNTTDEVVSEAGWSLPFERAQGHYWLRKGFKATTNTMYYTRTQLYHLHRHFRHPSVGKMYDLLRRTQLTELPPETLNMLTSIKDACSACQIFRNKDIRFSSKMKGDAVFNRHLELDIYYLDSKPVLHITDKDLSYGSSAFVKSGSKNPTSAQIWETFLKAWVLMYTGMPDIITTDRGTQFTSQEFSCNLSAHGVEQRFTGVESHHSLGANERAHQTVRRVFNKVRHDHPKISQELALAMSQKAINETAGPNGIVPVLLVYGTMPRYRMAGMASKLVPNSERYQIMDTARKEYVSIVNHQRVQSLLRKRVPPAIDRHLVVGEPVYVWRENLKRYSGPYPVLNLSHDGTQVTLDINRGERGGVFSADCVRPATDVAEILFSQISSEFSPHSNRGPDVSRPMYTGSHDDIPIFISEAVPLSDKRATEPKFTEAKKKELRGLLERGTFEMVLRQEVPSNAKVLRGRFVLVIKDVGTGEERYKARYVVQGFDDPAKKAAVHNSPNIRHESSRLLLAMASILGFEVWTQDISQAFLQAATANMREIYLEAPKELRLSAEMVLKLMKPLYGLCDSGDRWHHTLRHHHLSDMQMEPLTTDPSLYFRRIGDRLVGLSGVYVDDLLRCGTPEFFQLSKATGNIFDSTPETRQKAKFAGVTIHQTQNVIEADMNEYIAKLSVPTEQSWKSFISFRAKLAWLTYCRPDICANIAKLAQVTEKQFENEPEVHFESMRKATQQLRNFRYKLRYQDLDQESLYIRTYADASFGTNSDGSSQLGYCVLLMDKFDKFSLVNFRSGKCYRVTHSAMASETIAFAEAFDASYSIQHALQKLLVRPVKLQMLTDSKQLFDAISNSTHTKEKRLMIDIAAAKESFERLEISDLGLVRTEHMLADCLTKVMHPKQLLEALESGVLSHEIEKWIIRDTVLK